MIMCIIDNIQKSMQNNVLLCDGEHIPTIYKALRTNNSEALRNTLA